MQNANTPWAPQHGAECSSVALPGRFQIHLLTAVVLMLVAGGIIGVNVKQRDWPAWHKLPDPLVEISDEDWARISSHWSGGWNLRFYYGWPCDAMCLSGYVSYGHAPRREYMDEPVRDWLLFGTTVNSLIALSILLGVWILCERLIRRSAMGKGSRRVPLDISKT